MVPTVQLLSYCMIMCSDHMFITSFLEVPPSLCEAYTQVLAHITVYNTPTSYPYHTPYPPLYTTTLPQPFFSVGLCHHNGWLTIIMSNELQSTHITTNTTYTKLLQLQENSLGSRVGASKIIISLTKKFRTA